MFTWVCPSCGREWDLATKQCPDCAGKAAAEPTADKPPSAEPPVAKPPSTLRFWALIVVSTALVVTALVVWSRRRVAPAPRPAAKLEFQRPPEAPAEQRPLEVTGIRLFYDDQSRPQVRAVVVNHTEDPLPAGTVVRAALRPAGAPAGSPPLARFSVKLTAPLPGGDSRDLRAPLDALATLAAIPPWQQLRVDLE